MKKEKKSKIGRGKRFSNVFRLIDDLDVLNDGGKVERSTNKIHPPEIISNNDGSLLNSLIKI